MQELKKSTHDSPARHGVLRKLVKYIIREEKGISQMKEEKIMIPMELSELEDLLLIAHSRVLEEGNFTPEERGMAVHVWASAVVKLRKHLTGQEVFSEKELMDAKLSGIMAEWLKSSIPGGVRDEDIENYNR